MIIYIHRKNFVGNTFIEEDEAERIYRNVCNIEVCKSYIFGDINGEQLSVKLDHTNYNYHILND